MRSRTLTKDQLTEGDVVYLGRRLGDEPKQKKVYHSNRSLFDDDHDSDDYVSDHWDYLQVYEDYDSRSGRVSEETIAYYESIDVDRRITNHFGVIINLNKGKACDETKVFVCMVSELELSQARTSMKLIQSSDNFWRKHEADRLHWEIHS